MRRPWQSMPIHDVAVVGGGAAGLSAALVLGRARRRVAVIDAGAPRNAPAAHMQGFLSRDGMSPADLLAAGRVEATGYGVELIEDQVGGIEAGFVVRLAGGRVLKARRILVATGVRDVLPELPGVRERWARDLLHCPYCHGWEVRDRPIGVLGTLPGSVQHALLIRQWSDDVAFFVHTYDLTPAEEVQLEARGVRTVRGEVARLVVESDRLTGVELTDGRVIARTAVFIRPGNVPMPTATWLGSNRRFLEERDQFPDRVMAVLRVAQWELAMDFVPVPPPIARLCEVASLLEIADDAGRAPLCYPDACGDVPDARPRICGDAREDVCVVRHESPRMEVIAGIDVHESVLWYST